MSKGFGRPLKRDKAASHSAENRRMEVETAKRKRELGGELGEKPGRKEVERYLGSWVFEGKGVVNEDRTKTARRRVWTF